MTITTEPTPLSYNGNGSTTDFSITWKYFAKSDVVATLRDSDDAETTWVLDTDYTLTAAGVDTGGTLTATTAPASGETLVISLDPPNTQDSSLPVGGALPSSTIEDELDQAAQRDGKLETLFNRALRVPKTDLRTDDDLELPIDTVRANKFLKFDGNGNPTAAEGTATLGETGLFSQDTESELTISSGSVTPTVAEHSIDTEGDASTDNLDNIVTTNLADGRMLLIRGENASRVVTVRNAQGGAGQINTRGDVNVPLGVEKYMLLQRRGSDWYEVQIGNSSVVDDDSPQLGGALDTNSYAINESEGSAVASDTTTNIWVTDGNTVHVTGTTTITSFGTAPRVGAWRKVIFDGALTLTHGANLSLPGSANITTAADDFAFVYADTTTQFDVIYFKKNGEPVVGHGNVDVQTFTSSDTWTKPSSAPSTAEALVEVWGAGGSGGSRTSTGNAGGGGSGGYVSIIVPLSVLSATETVTIGAGGAGVSGDADGNTGGTTSCVVGSKTLSLVGGTGGGNDANGSAVEGGNSGRISGTFSTGGTDTNAVWPHGVNDKTGSGLNGAAGGFVSSGNAPAGGGNSVNGGGGGGGSASTAGGTRTGGTSVNGGNGGAGGANTGGNGTAGTAPSGGGGGAVQGGTSGAGGNGQVRISVRW